MNVGIAVSRTYLFVVNFAEPVVGRDGSGVGKNKSAYRIGNRGIFLNSPVAYFNVVVDGFLVIENGGFYVTEFFPLLTVKYITLGYRYVSCLNKHDFHAVLYVLDRDYAVLYLMLEIRRNLQRQHIQYIVVIFHPLRIERFLNRRGDLLDVELGYLSVSLFYSEHRSSSS